MSTWDTLHDGPRQRAAHDNSVHRPALACVIGMATARLFVTKLGVEGARSRVIFGDLQMHGSGAAHQRGHASGGDERAPTPRRRASGTTATVRISESPAAAHAMTKPWSSSLREMSAKTAGFSMSLAISGAVQGRSKARACRLANNSHASAAAATITYRRPEA